MRKSAGSSLAARHALSARRSEDRRRLTFALLLSLLIHLLLLRVTFSGQGLWIPGFAFPWQDRRVEAPDLRVVLAPARIIAAEPVQPAPPVEPTVSSRPSRMPPVSDAPKKGRLAAPRADAATEAAVAPAQPAAETPSEPPPPPVPAPAMIELPRSDVAQLVVPPAPQTVVPSVIVDAGDAEREKERLEVARQEEIRQEARRAEATRVEAARVEAAKAEAARLEAERQEAARVETARAEAARVEAAKVEAARAEAARLEAQRQEAARIEAARIEATRVEVARREAERQEAERNQAAKVEAARVEAEQEDARRDARRRALGRQLDEEADRRDAAAAAARLSPSYSALRRYRLFGRTAPNPEITLYAEAWSRKIQLNVTLDVVREVAKERHTDPVVTVAVRSDGSVESVTIIRSSGVSAVDEAIRRIVDGQKPYQVFPPGLASEYDVIEIRRTWHFDVAVRLY